MAQISEVKLYNGTVAVVFNNKARSRYIVDGHAPLGVTTILNGVLAKPALMLWPMREAIKYIKSSELWQAEKIATPELLDLAEKAHLTKSGHGKDIGTEVHGAIEDYLMELQAVQNGEKWDKEAVELSKEADKAFSAFVKWFNGLENVRVLATEQIVYSKELDYAGTYDALLEIDGKIVLCDIKTTNASQSAPMGIYPEHLIQMGGYAQAHLEENPLELIDDVMVINCSKTGVINTVRASDLDLEVVELGMYFVSCVALYRLLNGTKSKLGGK